MTWTEVKVEGYDFCLESGYYQIRRKGEQIGIYCFGRRFTWCDDVSEGMRQVWILKLRRRKQ